MSAKPRERRIERGALLRSQAIADHQRLVLASLGSLQVFTVSPMPPSPRDRVLEPSPATSETAMMVAEMSADMRPYVVRQGDYLTKLAWVHGFDAEEVWQHPKNAELAKLRTDHHVLAPGDVLFLPVKPAEGLPIQRGTSNKYVATVPKVEVKLHFRDGDDPLANEPCVVHGARDGDATRSTTNGDGELALDLPVSVREVTVYFPQKNKSYRVRVGNMDPAAEDSGIKQRLAHLGYHPGVVPDGMDEAQVLAAAVAAFQKKCGMDPTGTLDETTRQAIIDAHGR